MSESKSRPHVIWRRPDGYHGATPDDFRVLEVGHARIWVHRTNSESFPFKVSGSWAESDATKRLNNLLNLLDHPDADFVSLLCDSFHQTMSEDPAAFVDETVSWLGELKSNLKGDTWETEIMSHVFSTLTERIEDCREALIKRCGKPK